ncbi:hypothetical protein QTQ03_13100 [Micromonospora sp. WMMA1363]|uniref:hypothetical protein n=1 Tax=Micromonospora sp. WMMA1363 TaxID=3053985 RepID=UPI00259C987E|nr:hypothetical protein [Micromonospora sp. WMMA1363]MDM4720467.1 hypothetical protein [Micromonospora sp. WMMA1363]
MTEHHDDVAGRPDGYLEAAVHRLLAEHPDVAEQGITAVRRKDGLVLHGEVASPHRREEILRRVTELFPDVPITSDIAVVRAQAPAQIEQLP